MASDAPALHLSISLPGVLPPLRGLHFLLLVGMSHISFDDFANLIEAILSHEYVTMHFALVLGLGFLAVAEGECWMWVCPARIHTPKPLAFTPCPLCLVSSTILCSATPSRLCRSSVAFALMHAPVHA